MAHPARRTVVAVLAMGVIGATTVALDTATAMDAGPAPAPVAQSHLLDLVPKPLNCLVTTGFSMRCLGVRR